jgi:beta-1,4-mannosyltransferase
MRNENKINIAVFPLKNESNQYLKLLEKGIKYEDFNVYDLQYCLKSFQRFLSIKIVNLNWYENLGNNPLGMYVKRLLLLYVLKLFGKKIVFTFHNKIPHDDSSTKLVRKFIKTLCKKSDAIVGLCTETRNILLEYLSEEELNNKFHTIPHVSYEGAYELKNINYNKQLNLRGDSFKILFIGAVKPYKNIELIIEAAKKVNKNIVFIIAGKGDPEYTNTLKCKAGNNSNVLFIDRFIGNEEMYSLITNSNVLLIPYNINSSLNSGAAILAFTFNRTVICPEIGTLMDIPDKSLFWSYSYYSEEDHIDKIVKNINSAYELYVNSRERFVEKGFKIGAYVRKKYSLSNISEKYKELYYKLLGL